MENKKKVVVIDDSPIVRKMAEVALEEEGYEVHLAEDGEEGISITQEVLPSVILVDFIMPNMSGYQFCQAVKENELLKDIPIILITGKGEDVGKKFLEKFGVVDYFIKPFKSADLVDKVNSIIQMQKTMFQGEETAADITQQEAAPIEFLEAPEIETLQEIETAADIIQQEAAPIEFLEAPEIEKLQTAQTPVIAELEKIPMESNYTEYIDNAVERITKKFLQEEFQFTIQKSMKDILKQTGVIKSSDIILSGDLSVFPIVDVLHLITDKKLTAKLSIFSDILSAEIYFDQGNILNASKSNGSAAPSDKTIQFSRDSTVDEIHSLKENIYDTIYAAIELKSGSFSIEKISLSDNLRDIPIRLSMSTALIEASRKANDGVFSGMFDESTVFFKVLRDLTIKDYNLSKSELRISACINGERSIGDIIDISGLDKMQASKAFYVLLNSGIIKTCKGRI